MATPVLLGSKFRLNTTTLGTQWDPQLCLLKDGSFVAVWQEVKEASSSQVTRIQGQIFNADGTKKGKEFLVSGWNHDDQSTPVITVLNDGRFIVAWEVDLAPESSQERSEIRARAFQPNGTPVGPRFKITQVEKNSAREPSLTSLSDGGFAIAYTVNDGRKDDAGNVLFDIRTQVFGPSLGRSGVETTVNTNTSKSGFFFKSLLGLQDKYMGFFCDGFKNPLLGRILNNDGSTLSGSTDFVISANGGVPSSAKLADGRIVVAWNERQLTGLGFLPAVIIKAQILNPDGSKSGDELVLSQWGAEACSAPLIAASAEGGFTIAYSDHPDETHNETIRVAAFDENGSRMGRDLVVEYVPFGERWYLSLTALADGRVLLARDTYVKSRNDIDVYAQVVDPRQKAVDLAGTGSRDQYFGTRFDDKLAGAAGSDLLSGKAGRDTIHGGAGNDKLYGGSGKDVFVFDTAPNKSTNVDRIYDFNPKYDATWLEDSVFTGLGDGSVSTPVKFKSDMFVKGTKARDREDRIVYDSESGALYYDKDGTGRTAQVKIATITDKVKLSYHDFYVI